MKVLLTGASGLLGRAVSSALSARPGVELSALAFSRAKPPLIKIDITDAEAVETLFASVKPDFVIHAAAERRPDVVDKTPDLARKLNVAATEAIAKACAKSGAFLLYLSTDYVFDGMNPPYFPGSLTNPLNEYGRLKLEGERVIASILGADSPRKLDALALAEARLAEAKLAKAASGASPRAAILRVPLLYGPVERLGECSVTELATLLQKREPRAVDHWARRYPLHVDDVAAGILAIMDAKFPTDAGQNTRSDSPLRAASPAGLPIFLLSGPVAYTKYEMVLAMAKTLGIDASFVLPDTSPPKGAPRPRDCRMDTTLMESLGYRPRVTFEAGITSALAPFFGG